MITQARALIDRLEAGERIADADLRTLVELEAPEEIGYLLSAADRVRREQVGDAVHMRGLIEFSNYCRADCLYCGLRRSNAKITRYRLQSAEIEAAIAEAAEFGYRTVVLQAGEDLWYDGESIAGLVRYAKRLDLAVTLSLGERSREDLALWRAQGADRYLLRHETANPSLHQWLRPGRTLARRVETLRALRELGYQVGAGFMVGLPRQTGADLAADLRLLEELEADMVGIGPFIPNPWTPLSGAAGGTMAATLKMVALARLLLPLAMIPATTAMGSLDPLGREQALAAGANVLMPILTPAPMRAHYRLYPGKICLNESARQCRDCLNSRLQSIGRTVAEGPGHCPGWERRNHDYSTSDQ